MEGSLSRWKIRKMPPNMSGICNNFEDALELGEMSFWKRLVRGFPYTESS
jgi:hypothetical protein